MASPKRLSRMKKLDNASDRDVRALLKAIYDADPDFVDRIERGERLPQPEQLIPLLEADRLQYPCLVSAFLDYSGTGQVRTLGIIVTNAHSFDNLHQIVSREWGEHRSKVVKVRIWCGLPDDYEILDPNRSLELLEHDFGLSPAFRYTASLDFETA